MADAFSSPIEPRLGPGEKTRWGWREALGLLKLAAFMAAVFWSLGFNLEGDPKAEPFRHAVELVVGGGFLLRVFADAIARWRGNGKAPWKATSVRASPLQAVTDSPSEPREIERPRFDAALHALVFAAWLCLPLWRLPQLAARHDWPRFTVLGLLLAWAVFGLLKRAWTWLQRTEDAAPA